MKSEKRWVEGLETDRAIELIGRGLSAGLDADGNIKPRKKYSRDAAAAADIALYLVAGGPADRITIERVGCCPGCSLPREMHRHHFGIRVTLEGSNPDWKAEAEAWNDEDDCYSLTALAICRVLLMYEDDPDASMVLGRLERELRAHRASDNHAL